MPDAFKVQPFLQLVVTGEVNLLDIQPFIQVLGSGGYQAEADVNQDGAVNALDINGFVAILGS